MKKILRKTLHARRLMLSSAKAAGLSLKICRRLPKLREFRDAKVVMFYMPIRNEADPTPALEAALNTDKKLLLPCIRGNSLVAREYKSKLMKGKFGIPEPVGTAEVPPEEIDLVIVPGIAFDKHGGRIGYGKGYYDRFLKRARNAAKVALAYDFQVLPVFAKEPHDALVDKIITDKRIIECLR